MAESNRIENKRELTDNLEKEVIAFLNYREGGVIYIGIEDKTGKIYGVQNADELQLKIKDRIKNNISPSTMGLFDIILEVHKKKDVIKITVASGSEKPYHLTAKGMSPKGCFIRVGSASEPMSSKMIEELFSKRVRNSIGTIKSRNQSLTFEQLQIYYNATGFKLSEQFARNLELLTEDGNFNYAAYLLADVNGLSIKIAKYSGTNRVNLIENEEFGYCSIVKATKTVLEKLKVENKTFTRITSTIREEHKLLNPVAVREAVVNAIVHNNYFNEVPPKFELFDDRLEITSAGGLPPEFTKEEFFMGYSVPQNKELMRIFRDINMVEQLGSGVPRILEHYPKSIYQFSQNFIKVVLPFTEGYAHATEQATEQASGQAIGQAERILIFCAYPRTNKEIMEHLGVRHREHFRNTLLLPLISEGEILLTIPDKPSSPKQKYVTNSNWQKGKL
ncbi:MAG: putative DNA binding domain-containing protein [Melioribacteraceae bacterium]|jgi:ATP-dependent DNA helicase RecG|nr:putative DNA binding domain-containing protein [Melioribacteraceae bacterium]